MDCSICSRWDFRADRLIGFIDSFAYFLSLYFLGDLLWCPALDASLRVVKGPYINDRGTLFHVLSICQILFIYCPKDALVIENLICDFMASDLSSWLSLSIGVLQVVMSVHLFIGFCRHPSCVTFPAGVQFNVKKTLRSIIIKSQNICLPDLLKGMLLQYGQKPCLKGDWGCKGIDEITRWSFFCRARRRDESKSVQ